MNLSLTETSIRTATPNELDALAAVFVMGWEDKGNYYLHNESMTVLKSMWLPHHYISDAWRIVGRMEELGWSCQIRSGKRHNYAIFEKNQMGWIDHNEIIPTAITRAALRAILAGMGGGE